MGDYPATGLNEHISRVVEQEHRWKRRVACGPWTEHHKLGGLREAIDTRQCVGMAIGQARYGREPGSRRVGQFRSLVKAVCTLGQ